MKRARLDTPDFVGSVIGDTYDREVVMTESNGISIQTMCYQCQALTELCPDCQEQKDANDIYLAHKMVDESQDFYYRGYGDNKVAVANTGSVGEPRPLSVSRDAESGHDWVGSITKLRRPAIQMDGSIVEERYELLDPISLISDRLFDLETSLTVTTSEVVCQSCHLIYNKHQAECPVCY